MTKVLNGFTKLFLIFCFFVSPLIFLTDFARNPYIIQNTFLVLGSLGALFFIVLNRVIKKEFVFGFSKADIALLSFIAVALISLAVNYFVLPTPKALLNEFWRRGHILITNLFCGYFIARLISGKTVVAQEAVSLKTEENGNYKNGLLLLIWGCFWLPFAYFRMRGFFDVYGLLMWFSGIFIVFRFLKQITPKNIFDLLLAVCALACAYGLCQNLGWEFLWPFDISRDFGTRSISTFGNPNFISSFILLALPLGVVYFICAKEKLAKVYYLFICLLYIACLAVTQTRSSWLGAFFAFIILFSAASFRKLVFKNIKKTVVLFIMAGALFFFWPSQETKNYKSLVLERTAQESLIKPSNLTLGAKNLNQAYHQRLMMWTCGVDNFKQKPWLGWGWGSWQLTFAPCQGKLLNKYPALAVLKTQANSAHNIFIETLSQSGLTGLICFLFFILLTCLGFRKYYLKQTDTKIKLFYLALFASFIAFLADNMLNITSQITVLAFMFYFVMGLLASLEVKEREIKKPCLIFFLVLAGIFFLFFNFKNYKNLVSSAYSFKAYKEVLLKRDYRADKLLTKALNLSKESAEDFYLQTLVLVNLKAYHSLEELLKEALTYFPYFYEFYFRQAALKEIQGDTPQAFSYIKKTLALYPFYEPAFSGILNLLAYNKELRSLENAEYIKKLSLPLSFKNAYTFLLYQIYFEHGLYEQARELLLELLSQNKFDETAQQKLAEVNKKLSIKDDNFLREAKELTLLRKEILSSEQISSALLNKAKKAAQSKDVEAQMLLAQVYFKKQDFKESRLILEELYKDYPDFLPLNFALVSLEEAVKNKKQAAKYLHNILAQDPGNTLALRRLDSLN